MRRALILFAMLVVVLAVVAAPAYAQERGDILRFGSNVVIPRDTTETGSVTLFGGNAVIDGGVDEDVTLFGGNLQLNGRVGRNVTVFGGNTTLGSNAVIEGDFTHFGGNVDRAPGARVLGNETSGFRGGPFDLFSGLFVSLLWLIATAILGIAVVAVFPNQTAVLADTIEREPLASFGAGFLATILIPFVFVALALLILVGWILIPFVALVIPLLYFYGYVGVARWLGRRFIEATHIANETPIAQILTGILILGLIGLVPFFGWLVVLIAAFTGLGAVILSRFGTGRPWRRERPTPPAQTPEAGGGTQGAA